MAKAKNPFLKRSGEQNDFTSEQIIELQKCSDDPEYFIVNYCKIQQKGGVGPFTLRPYQKRILKMFFENRYSIALAPRQIGKSWIAGAFLLWWSSFKFDQTILICSNKNANAMEMIRRVRFMYERMPMWLKPGLNDDGWNKHELGFDNGCRILSQATTEDSGRGLSIDLLFLDEFAFVKDNIANEFWSSVSPTLATSGGQCIICSTPNGDTNLFAQIWRGAETNANGYASIEIKWDEPPDRDEAFKEAEIAKIGEIRWRQEYCCEFISSDPLLINSIVLAGLSKSVQNNKPVAVIGDITFWKLPEQNSTYVIGVDPATGSGNDFTTFVVFEFPSLEQVAEFRSNTMSSVVAYQALKRLFKAYEKVQATVYFSVENNGVGEGIISLLEADETPMTAEFISETGANRKGMNTNGKTKIRACLSFKEMIERNTLHINSPTVVGEMKHFIRHAGSYAAKKGATDDLVAGTLIAIRVIEEIATFDQTAYDKIYSSAYFDETGGGEWDNNYEPDPVVI